VPCKCVLVEGGEGRGNDSDNTQSWRVHMEPHYLLTRCEENTRLLGSQKVKIANASLSRGVCRER